MRFLEMLLVIVATLWHTCWCADFTNYWNKDFAKKIIVAGDTVWESTSCGFVKRDTSGTILGTFTLANGLPEYMIHDFDIDKKRRLWYVGDSGFYCFNGINWSAYHPTVKLMNNNAKIKVDSVGKIWCSAYSRLFRFDGKDYLFFDSTNVDSLKTISTIYIDRFNNLWVGSGLLNKQR